MTIRDGSTDQAELVASTARHTPLEAVDNARHVQDRGVDLVERHLHLALESEADTHVVDLDSYRLTREEIAAVRADESLPVHEGVRVVVFRYDDGVNAPVAEEETKCRARDGGPDCVRVFVLLAVRDGVQDAQRIARRSLYASLVRLQLINDLSMAAGHALQTPVSLALAALLRLREVIVGAGEDGEIRPPLRWVAAAVNH